MASCSFCSASFERNHFNQKCCSDECRWKAKRTAQEKYKKSEKGILSDRRWVLGDKRKQNEKRYRQNPRAKHLAVLRAIRCLKKNAHLLIKKREHDKAFSRTKRGKEINCQAKKKYRKTDKGRQANKNAKAIRRQREHTGKITAQEWRRKLDKYNNSCAKCGCQGKMEQDHIMPLSRGGAHNIDNVQPLCRKCNAVKGAKIES